ncbi:MAG: hypothetical protein LBV55_00055, partial [Acholeplasmatales bacterium]|nr:hypothetical protein [Acholeplasmatales bacterium]
LLLDFYGILQALFVGIDALYELGQSLHNSKYQLNFKENPALKNLKFIRNDLIGHPVNRLYADNSTGYSVFDLLSLKTRMEVRYTTYIINSEKIITKNQRIDIFSLIDNFLIERDKVLSYLTVFDNIDEKQKVCVISLFNLIFNQYFYQKEVSDQNLLNALNNYRILLNNFAYDDRLVLNLNILLRSNQLLKKLKNPLNLQLFSYYQGQIVEQTRQIVISIFNLASNYFPITIINEQIITKYRLLFNKYQLNNLINDLIFGYQDFEECLQNLQKVADYTIIELVNILREGQNDARMRYLTNKALKMIILI